VKRSAPRVSVLPLSRRVRWSAIFAAVLFLILRLYGAYTGRGKGRNHGEREEEMGLEEPRADGMAASAPPPSTTPRKTVQLWGSYAKDRFDSVSTRVDEFRNWARQLAAAMAVVIGIELTLTGKVLDLKVPFDVTLRNSSLLAFFSAVVLQAILLLWTLHTGYVGQGALGPESPSVLAGFILGKPPEETQQIIAAYYANAYDHFFTLSEGLAQRVGRATRLFAWSIVLPLVGFGLFVVLAWSPTSATRYNQQVMAQPAKPLPPSPSPRPSGPKTPAPQTPVEKPSTKPSSNPLMNRPTPGQPMTEDDHTTKVHRG
jgi:hypothetical protein